MKKDGYREGNEEPTKLHPEETVEEAPTQEAEPQEQMEIHETAILLVLTSDGRLEAATNLPNLPVRRQASLRDIRDLCHAMYSDIQVTLMGKSAAHESSQAIQRTLAQSQIQNVAKMMRK
jgi:hypothetical protein